MNNDDTNVLPNTIGTKEEYFRVLNSISDEPLDKLVDDDNIDELNNRYNALKLLIGNIEKCKIFQNERRHTCKVVDRLIEYPSHSVDNFTINDYLDRFFDVFRLLVSDETCGISLKVSDNFNLTPEGGMVLDLAFAQFGVSKCPFTLNFIPSNKGHNIYLKTESIEHHLGFRLDPFLSSRPTRDTAFNLLNGQFHQRQASSDARNSGMALCIKDSRISDLGLKDKCIELILTEHRSGISTFNVDSIVRDVIWRFMTTVLLLIRTDPVYGEDFLHPTGVLGNIVHTKPTYLTASAAEYELLEYHFNQIIDDWLKSENVDKDGSILNLLQTTYPNSPLFKEGSNKC